MGSRKYLMAGLAAFALVRAGQSLAEDAPQKPLTDQHATVEGAIATPAEDLNIKKKDIPDVLQRAVADPYDLRGASDCVGIAQEVARLDLSLGADKDTPQAPDDKKITAGDAVKAGVEAVIPYRGIIRTITGANAHEKEVQKAVQAGFARRGFLKGRALEMNCPPGASPAWYRAAELPATQPPAPAPTQVALAPGRIAAEPAPPVAEASTATVAEDAPAIEARPLAPLPRDEAAPPPPWGERAAARTDASVAADGPPPLPAPQP